METNLSASLQNYNMHMSRMIARPMQSYAAFMGTKRKSGSREYKDEAIQVVSKWAQRVGVVTKWAPSRWASEAGISDTTMTRGIGEDSSSTPKIENLHALARAAKVPSVLDFLATEAASMPPQPWIPSEPTLTFVIEVLSNALSEGRFYPDEAPKFAHAWRAALEYFAADPDMEHNEGYRAGAVQIINRAIRDYTKPHEQAA